MGTNPSNPDIEAVYDASTHTACLRLHLDLNIQSEQYMDLAALLIARRFDKAEA